MAGSSIARNRGFYLTTDENGRVTETPTFTCPHCNKVVATKPRTAPTNAMHETNPAYRELFDGVSIGWCHRHFSRICARCAVIMDKQGERCPDFEDLLERYAARQALRLAAGS